MSDRSGGGVPTHVGNKDRVSVGSGRIGLVAHAVTTSSATPILLRAATRASRVFKDGWPTNATVTNG